MAYIGKSPTGTGVRSRYYYTATGGETSLSGADDNSNTLVFSDGNYVDVSLNGIALVAGTDYNTSTANTIGGLSALSASDIVEIVVYDIFTVADTVSAKDGGTFSGNVAMGGTTTFSGDVVGAVQEYFQVALTTAQDGISDGIATVVDFGGKGTVIYDTKNKFDSSNDAYEFDSADGVYLISFSIGIRSDVVATEILVEVGGRVQFSTDNFSNTLDAQNQEFGNAARVMNNSSDSMGTLTVTGQYIYKNTAAGTKIRLQGTSDTTGGTYEFAIATDNMINVTFGSAARCTYLTVVRIA
jgi:hypothetical protein